MTKQEFFEKPEWERKALILMAHEYYMKGLCYDTEVNKIPVPYIKEFVLMCNNERKMCERYFILD